MNTLKLDYVFFSTFILLLTKIIINQSKVINAVPHTSQKIIENHINQSRTLQRLPTQGIFLMQIMHLSPLWRVPRLLEATRHAENNRPCRKTLPIQTIKSEYYNNAYSCNGCSKSKTVDDDGIWHCSTCNYDLCPDCLEWYSIHLLFIIKQKGARNSISFVLLSVLFSIYCYIFCWFWLL